MCSAKLPLGFLLLSMTLASLAHAHGGYKKITPEEQRFASAKFIADVTISKVDAEGYVSLKVHEYIRKGGIPREIKAKESVKSDIVNIGSLAGGRYILFAAREYLDPETYYRVRLNAERHREVEYQHTWISFEEFKKRIPEPFNYGESDPRKVLAQISVVSGRYYLQVDGSLQNDPAFMRIFTLLSSGTLNHASPKERSDRDFMLEVIRRNPYAYSQANFNLWTDQKFILEVARLFLSRKDFFVAAGSHSSIPTILNKTPVEIRDNRDLVLKLVRLNGLELEFASDRLRADREVAEAAGAAGLRYADPTLRDDRALVLKLVAQDGNALTAASYRLKSDREVVLAAVRSAGGVLYQLPAKFREDREVVLAAMRSGGGQLHRLPKKFQTDREIVLAAVTRNGSSLLMADEKFKNDREIVLAAVKSTYQALRWASPKMRRDPEIGMEAVRQDARAIEDVYGDNPGIREIALEALRQKPRLYRYLPSALKKDSAFLEEAGLLSPRIKSDKALYKEFLLARLEKTPYSLAMVPFVHDPDFMLRAGEKSFYALAYAKGPAAKDPRVLAMKDDRKRVERAIERGHAYALSTASVRLQKDPKLIKKALDTGKIDGKRLGQMLHSSVWEDRKGALELLKTEPKILAGAPWRIRADREMVLTAVRQNGEVFSAVDRVLRADREVVLAALKSRPDLAKEIFRSARGGVQWDKDVRKFIEKDFIKVRP